MNDHSFARPQLATIVPWDSTDGGSQYIPALVAAAAYGTAAWITAKRVVYIPFVLARQAQVTSLIWGIGVNGNNSQAGIYNQDGVRLVTTGTQVNAVGLNKVAVSLTLGPGTYYMALTSDTATDTYNRKVPTVDEQQRVGVLDEVTGSFGLPATATFGTTTQAYIPFMALELKGAVVT